MSLASILLAAVALGVLIIVHEFGHYWVAKRGGMRVSRFSVGFGPVLLRTQKDETEFVLSAVPLGGYVQVDGLNPHDGTNPDDPQGYQRRPFHLKLAMVLGGPFANYVLGFFLLFMFLGAFREISKPPVRVVSVAPDSPAMTAGLKEGDLITGTASTAFVQEGDFLRAIDTSGGNLALQVRRGDETLSLVAQPTPRSDGKYRLGVQYELITLEPAPLGWGEAVVKAGQATWTTSMGILTGLASIFDDDARLSGPIGIV